MIPYVLIAVWLVVASWVARWQAMHGWPMGLWLLLIYAACWPLYVAYLCVVYPLWICAMIWLVLTGRARD